MDNRNIRITSEGDEALALALKLIWPNAIGGMATHYYIGKYISVTSYRGIEGEINHHSTSLVEREEGDPTLILLWSAERNALPLPFPLELDGATHFVQNWLKTVDYGKEPDHDGDNGNGWYAFTDFWGHVAGHRYGIVGVQPAWAMYGK